MIDLCRAYNPRRTSEAFQSGWVLAHLDDAEASVRKPLLLEEFGKKLSAVEYVNGSIGGKRDPIFRSMYRTVEDALAACAPSYYNQSDLLMYVFKLPVFSLDSRTFTHHFVRSGSFSFVHLDGRPRLVAKPTAALSACRLHPHWGPAR